MIIPAVVNSTHRCDVSEKHDSQKPSILHRIILFVEFPELQIEFR